MAIYVGLQPEKSYINVCEFTNYYVHLLFLRTPIIYTGSVAKQSIELLLVVLSTKCKLFVMAPITFLLQEDTRPLRWDEARAPPAPP